jgi:hypothetical protein
MARMRFVIRGTNHGRKGGGIRTTLTPDWLIALIQPAKDLPLDKIDN